MRTATLATVLLGVAALPAQDREFGAPVSTTLDQVRAEPHAYKNVNVKFTVQYASLGRISNPFFTKFTPSDFANFYGWADEQAIWQENSYEDLFGMLFLSKFSDQLEELYQLETYDRIQIHGVVRATFQDMPWIEVLAFEKLDSKLDTTVLTHLYRGEKLMQQRLWQRAISEFSVVPGDDVPANAQIAAFQGLGTCLLRIGEAQSALGYLQTAKDMTDGRNRQINRLLAIAQESPEEAIDRTVDSRVLKDHERPMWEAFDAGAGESAGM